MGPDAATLSDNVRQAYANAELLAAAHDHGYVTLEHLLLELGKDADIIKLYEAQQVDQDRLRGALTNFIKDELTNLIIPEDSGYFHNLRMTTGVDITLRRAVSSAHLDNRREATALDVIESIFSRNESHAHYFLLEAGLTRSIVKDFIAQHPRPSQAPFDLDATLAYAAELTGITKHSGMQPQHLLLALMENAAIQTAMRTAGVHQANLQHALTMQLYHSAPALAPDITRAETQAGQTGKVATTDKDAGMPAAQP